MARPARIYIAAAEASGDMLAAELIDALRRADPNVEIAGMGGPEMARRGIVSPFDISDLSVFGLLDGVRIVRLVHERAEQAAQAAAEFGADAAVLIDSWGFMLRLAWKLEARAPDIKRIKYVGPQVFAARRGRAKVLARHVDHLLAIHPFDAEYFEPHGLKTTFVGNPALARDLSGDGRAFRKRHGIRADEDVLLMLLGSRRGELERLFEPFATAAGRLREARPQTRLVTALAPSIAVQAREMIAAEPAFSNLVIVDAPERLDAFHAADAALACSGTVTLELARLGVPTIAAYRLGWMNWALARYILMKAKYISLVNIAADEMLIPEYVQMDCTGDRLAEAAYAMLEDARGRDALSERLREVTEVMAGEGGDPATVAARTILDLVQAKADGVRA
ncbi:lipid-A-disaccharide synthase [Hyphomonadaceae bacterium BL14]|nr:lipid-A-disaccharide synthase [Hyphomonadaceae bacterium BL14]